MTAWYNKLLPLSQRQEIEFAMPYMMALRVLELGEATDDNLAKIAGHLKIAVYLPCDAHIIDDGRRAIRRLIKAWQNDIEFDPLDIELVGQAIHCYHECVRNINRQRLQKAIQKVLKGVGN